MTFKLNIKSLFNRKIVDSKSLLLPMASMTMSCGDLSATYTIFDHDFDEVQVIEPCKHKKDKDKKNKQDDYQEANTFTVYHTYRHKNTPNIIELESYYESLESLFKPQTRMQTRMQSRLQKLKNYLKK